MRGRPKVELVLNETEREQLTALTLRRKTAQALALRARIVLAAPVVRTIRTLRRANGSRHRRSVNGVHALSNSALMDCLMHRARAHRAALTMRVSMR